MSTIMSVLALLAVSDPPRNGVGEAEKLVCKRDAVTGTRFAKRVCFTRAQWDDRAERDRRALAEATGNQVQRDTGRN